MINDIEAKGRRLSDDESRAILLRASEIDALQEQRGLTVAELRDIAEQVGIAPEALSAALGEMARAAEDHVAGPKAWLSHSDRGFVVGTLSDENVAWLLRLLDQLGQVRGDVSSKGNVVAWHSPEGFRVELLSRHAETHVVVSGIHLREFLKAGVGIVGAGLLIGIVGADLFNSEIAFLAGLLSGAVGLGAYWKARIEKLRSRAAKTAIGVSEVVRMVLRRHEDAT